MNVWNDLCLANGVQIFTFTSSKHNMWCMYVWWPDWANRADCQFTRLEHLKGVSEEIIQIIHPENQSITDRVRVLQIEISISRTQTKNKKSITFFNMKHSKTQYLHTIFSPFVISENHYISLLYYLLRYHTWQGGLKDTPSNNTRSSWCTCLWW